MLPFRQVDVFSEAPLRGNPVAVVHAATGLTTEQMERFTRWTNLVEATFLLPPDDPAADYQEADLQCCRKVCCSPVIRRLGPATPGWRLVDSRTTRRGSSSTLAGLVPLRPIEGRLAFQAPPLRRSGPVDPALQHRLETILGISNTEIIESQWVDNGPGWVAVLLESAAAVLAIEPRDDGGPHLDIGLVGFHPPGSETTYEVRAVFGDGRGGLIDTRSPAA